MTNPIQLLKSRLSLYFSVFIISVFAACDNADDDNIKTINTAGGYSVIIANNTPLISGYGSKHNKVTSRFWKDTDNVDENNFDSNIPNQTLYRKAIDENHLINYVYKDAHGQYQYYQFDQGSLAENGRVFYYKNEVLTFMDNDSIGTVTAVNFHNDQPYFAGAFGEVSTPETGKSFHPTIPFIWDGNDLITTLSLPDQTSSFQGITTIYVESPETVYVGGLCGKPMYWKNSTSIILDERYGEVWQVTKSGEDIYAVGLVNKHNSNSTGHTACYWKNGELHELEDNAQAYGIFIDGDDVYVSGAFGPTPIDYKPCYWKNGVRVALTL